MPSLDAIRQKYPTANYAPDPNCKRCGGTGEVSPALYIVIDEAGSHTEWRDEPTCCICIFVAHDLCDLVADGLRELADLESGL